MEPSIGPDRNALVLGSRIALAGSVALASACLTRPLTVDEDATSTDGTSTSDAAPDPSAGPTPTTVASTGSEPPDPSADPPGETTSIGVDDTSGFEPLIDGLVGIECDPFAQDCPDGFKCAPWANDGGPSWNTTHCVPIARDASQFGDACTVEEPIGSGVDDCDLGLVCWYVDQGTLTGTCLHMCGGTPNEPTCPGDETCAYGGDSVIGICLPNCDPLAPMCPEGEMCLPLNDQWACGPDASGDSGAHGDACEFINACDPGLACIPPEHFTECRGVVSCCSTLCDLDDGMADEQCAALDPAQSCIPWYEPGSAPEGHADLGVCGIPQ